MQQSQPVVKREATNSRQLTSDMTPDYVAGELRKENLPETFTIGDGKTYGGFDNKPLESNTEYDIYLGSVSRTSDTVNIDLWISRRNYIFEKCVGLLVKMMVSY